MADKVVNSSGEVEDSSVHRDRGSIDESFTHGKYDTIFVFGLSQVSLFAKKYLLYPKNPHINNASQYGHNSIHERDRNLNEKKK